MKLVTLTFSPTHSTQRIVSQIADGLEKQFSATQKIERLKPLDMTLPKSREIHHSFDRDTILIIGVPVYAGRVPNLMLPYLNTLQGNGAIAIPVAVFGNRAVDDALIELRDILIDTHFFPIAGGAFVAQHSFSETVATGRPNAEDLLFAANFGAKCADKLFTYDLDQREKWPVIYLPGKNKAERDYFKPVKKTGEKFDMRKTKPTTSDACIDCKKCAEVCPMGAIDFNDVRNVPGTCIKCYACIKVCPTSAKQFTDPDFLFHIQDIANRLAKNKCDNTMYL